MNQNLTVNVGVRYEVNSQMVETGNRLANIELDRFVIASDDEGRIHPDADALLPLIPVPYVTSKEAGYHRSLQRPNFNRVAPRFGLAWFAGWLQSDGHYVLALAYFIIRQPTAFRRAWR